MGMYRIFIRESVYMYRPWAVMAPRGLPVNVDVARMQGDEENVRLGAKVKAFERRMVRIHANVKMQSVCRCSLGSGLAFGSGQTYAHGTR